MFQFESRGMRELLKQAPVTRFEDIIALVALYRPGPMELIPDYVARKSGRERVPIRTRASSRSCRRTYGVMVYQEQVMKIAQEIGGYTLGGADLLRRAMGKKKPEEMAKHRTIFVDGATKNGVRRAKATLLFDLMEKFAGYGFNKSHAAAYALVAYQTAYFKAHHPAAFMAANLSLVMDDTDKVRVFRDDAIAQGLAVLPPDINASNYRFEPVDATRIRYGLGGVKGTGQAAIEAIVAARASWRRVPRPLRLLPAHRQAHGQPARRRGAGPRRRVRRDRAAASGAAGLGRHRAGSRGARRSQCGAGVALRRGSRRALAVAPRRDARVDRRRAAAARKDGHWLLPLRAPVRRLLRRSLRRWCARRSPIWRRDKKRAGRRHRHAAAGAVEPPRQDGVRHARRRPCVGRALVYNEVFDGVRQLLREDQLVIAEVKVSAAHERGWRAAGLRIMADNVYDLATLRRKRAKGLKLACNGNASAARLAEILQPHRPGDKPITIQYRNERRRRRGRVARTGASISTTRCSIGCATGWRRRTCKCCTRRAHRVTAHTAPPAACAGSDDFSLNNAKDM